MMTSESDSDRVNQQTPSPIGGFAVLHNCTYINQENGQERFPSASTTRKRGLAMHLPAGFDWRATLCEHHIPIFHIPSNLGLCLSANACLVISKAQHF